jgi:hypothetical protein
MSQNQDSAPEMSALAFLPDFEGIEMDHLLEDLPLEEGAIPDDPIAVVKPRLVVELALSARVKVEKAPKEDSNPYNWSIRSQRERVKASAAARAARGSRERFDNSLIDPVLGIYLSKSERAAQARALQLYKKKDPCQCLGQDCVGFICCCRAPEAPSSMSLAGLSFDISGAADERPMCCICMGDDCEGGSNKFTCGACGSGCCEPVARQLERGLLCPNVVEGKVCGGPLTAAGKAKKKVGEIEEARKKMKVQDQVQKELASHGHFGRCGSCDEDYFFEEESPPKVNCSTCLAEIVLFCHPPEQYDALSDDYAFKRIYGGKCPTCNEDVTRTPEYEIMDNGMFSNIRTGECAATFHSKCGTSMCISGNRNCRAFLKTIADFGQEQHEVTDHMCQCYGVPLNRDGSCSNCKKCRNFTPVYHWVNIFLWAKAEWYIKNALKPPENILKEISYDSRIYA